MREPSGLLQSFCQKHLASRCSLVIHLQKKNCHPLLHPPTHNPNPNNHYGMQYPSPTHSAPLPMLVYANLGVGRGRLEVSPLGTHWQSHTNLAWFTVHTLTAQTHASNWAREYALIHVHQDPGAVQLPALLGLVLVRTKWTASCCIDRAFQADPPQVQERWVGKWDKTPRIDVNIHRITPRFQVIFHDRTTKSLHYKACSISHSHSIYSV
jgi:hypothetical protein